MGFPATIESPDVTMQGTTALATDDHAQAHRVAGSAVIDIQTFLGTNAGTNVFKNYLSGWFPLAIVYTAGGQGTFQTIIASGTINNSVFGTPAITGGTASSQTLGTPVIDIINARTAGTGVIFGNSMLPAQGSLTDSAGGTLTADARAAQIYYSVMGTTAGNRTIGTPTNPSNYQQLSYAFKTSGSANGTLVWASVFRISQDMGTPTLGTGVSWNYYNWRYNAIDTKWDYIGQVLNLV